MYWIGNKNHNWSVDGNNLHLTQGHFIIDIKLIEADDNKTQYELRVCDSERQITGIKFSTIEESVGYAEEVCKTCHTLEEAEEEYQKLFSVAPQNMPQLKIKNRYSDYNGTGRIDEDLPKSETQRIFEETGKIGNEIAKKHKQIDNLNMQCLEIMKKCPHEIVFKYRDNHPKLLPVDGTYFCPACGMAIRTMKPGDIQYSSFRTSRIIPLTNISLLGTKDVYQTIRQEVYANLELYYNPETDPSKLSGRMENILKDKQYDYYKERASKLGQSPRQRTRKEKQE